ncbi:MAG: FMN-binding protein [Candidatus Delongbacteria bacterium]|nr:FMN-binding protein [Candidatus Delongbacteria bacterium]
MAKKNKTAARIKMVVFMFSITFVFVVLLSFVHLYTKSRVTRNEKLFLKRSVLYTADMQIPNSDEDLDIFFSENVTETAGINSIPEYRFKNSSIVIYTIDGAGLWGVIRAHVGFDSKTGKMTGIDFIKQSETPGLGARIAEDWFREQFRGKKGPFTYVPEGENDTESQFDAITGATVTTKAIKDIVNKVTAINNAEWKRVNNE